MPWQQRGVVADAAETRSRECFVADARMRMRRDDDIRARGDGIGRHQLRILQHVYRYAGGLRRHRNPVVGCGGDHASDVDAFLPQRLEHRRAEIARSHQCDLHRIGRARKRTRDGRRLRVGNDRRIDSVVVG
jgi:hypothetical protein